jgi:hypothetical protein
LFLVDSNVWLEVLLEQEHAESASSFLIEAAAEQLFMTEFAVYSIGIVLTRLKQSELYTEFLKDLSDSEFRDTVRLTKSDLVRVSHLTSISALDFDDAYQYVAAEKYGLTIVSFDSDFDKTERGRVTPAQALQMLKDERP